MLEYEMKFLKEARQYLTLCASGQEIVLDLEQTNHWTK